MKIAIFDDYGGGCIPNFLFKEINDQNRNYRLVLAEELEKLPVTNEVINQEIYDKFENDKSAIYLKDGKGKYYFKNHTYLFPYSIKLVDINKDTPWKIEEYDGAEHVVFFNGVKVVDEETGMAEW